MTFSPTSKQVVLKETFDESSEPTYEEIQEYAVKIGINIDEDAHLLSLARDWLLQPLPADWSPCYDADQPDRIYYFNFKTGRAQWIHPLEEIHRQLVIKAKAHSKLESLSLNELQDDDSRTTVKEDLKSFEEAPSSESQRSGMKPKPRLLEPIAPIPPKGAMRKPPDTLGPLKIAAPASSPEVKKVSFDECEVKKRPNSSDIRNRRNIGPMEFRHLSKQEIITPKAQWRDEGYATESSLTQPPTQLTLSGGGNMFLRKLTKPALETSVSKALEQIERKDSKDDSLAEDEKNSVSLKLEKPLKVNFKFPAPPTAELLVEKSSALTSLSDSKQIEIDFEDLKLDIEQNVNVPKQKDLKKVTQDVTGMAPKGNEMSSLSNFKKSINIVLNDQIANDSSQDERKSENLIDLTEGESLSTIGSKKDEFVPPPKSVLLDLQALLNENEPIKAVPASTVPKPPIEPKQGKKETVKFEQPLPNNSALVAADEPKEPFLEKTRSQLENARVEKLKMMEGEFNDWVKNTEKMFREKEKKCYGNMMEHYEDWRKNEENGMIKEMGEKCAEELQAKIKSLRNDLLREEQEAVENLKSTLTAQTRERLRALREEIEAREQREIAQLKKTLEEGLSKRKEELYRKHQEEMNKVERSLEALLAEQRVQRQHELEKAREDESALAAMRAQLKDAFLQQKTIVQQEHEMALQKLRQQQELEMIQAVNNRAPLSDAPEDGKRSQSSTHQFSDQRTFEKLRCEKRLLEDKYKGLKEKYIRLKTDVKLTLEKKASKKKEQSASETDKSHSHRSGKAADSDTPMVKAVPEREKPKKASNLDQLNQNIASELDFPMKNGPDIAAPVVGHRGDRGNESSEDEADNKDRMSARKRRQFFNKLKAASTSKLNTQNRNQGDDPLSPVENLRRQLKKLEELEDQFPVTPHTDTYLRYPFTDPPAPHFASSELEFFKHRIHLERDSVRRAKEFLKAQKKCYENRQRELQHRLTDGGPPSRSIIDKIHQEERELTEMEVSVHRTRALLGEKIIRLRHLEQSLRRAAPSEPKSHHHPAHLAPRSLSRDDATLSDLSSHSDSSGFSSTHHTSEPLGPRVGLDKNKRHLLTSMQESNEIIQSLENLNSEIRGIWEVLKQSSSPGSIQLPPPPLAWPAVRTNPTANLLSPRPLTQMKTQVSGVGRVTTVVDASLVDRTRSLRDWLKSARRSPNPTDQIINNQVTL